MREACICGRTGEVKDREPVTTATGEPAHMNHWSKNRRMVAEVKDEETQRMQERFEQELVLSANWSPVRGALSLGEADS